MCPATPQSGASERVCKGEFPSGLPLSWASTRLQLDRRQHELSLEQLFIPKREIRCEFIEGESGPEKGKRLALRLQELKLI